MGLTLRWILIAGACVLCDLILFTGKERFRLPLFEIENAALPQQAEKSFFNEEVLNVGQDLPMVHVASLTTMTNGTMAAIWYGGPAECASDVEIYFSERPPHSSWTAPRAIMTRQQATGNLVRPVKALGNAVLLGNPDGSQRLLFVTIAMGKWSGSQLNTCASKDGGRTWSKVERLILSPFFNFSELVRNRPVPMTGGGWCVPFYQEFLGKFPELLRLKEVNGGLITEKSRIAGGCSSFQPSLIPLDAKRAVVLLRDYTDARKIFVSRSENGGITWTTPVPTNLPNPDAGISGLRLSDGQLLVAYNDSPAKRENLSLAVSSDEGGSWKKITELEFESGKSFSYPYLTRSSDGVIHMIYTWKSKQIKMLSFNEIWIKEQEASINP